MPMPCSKTWSSWKRLARTRSYYATQLDWQIHWGGNCFAVEGSQDAITVFTTRQDTVFGATFMSIAATHPMVVSLVQGTGKEAEVEAFAQKQPP